MDNVNPTPGLFQSKIRETRSSVVNIFPVQRRDPYVSNPPNRRPRRRSPRAYFDAGSREEKSLRGFSAFNFPTDVNFL